MTDVRALLSRLARIEDGPPVITVALDTHWKDEQQRDRVRVFVRDRVRDARRLFEGVGDEALDMARTLDRIEQWADEVVNRDRHEGAGGLVLYASEARDLFVECVLPQAGEQGMWVDTRPRLWPLALQLELTRPLIVVDVQATGAHIAQWQFGELDEQSIERDVPNRHKMGGWSQARYQRHVRDHIQRVWKECAALLQKLVLEDQTAHVVLLGQGPNLRAFQRQLPQAVADRVVAMRPSPPEPMKRVGVGLEVLEEERVAHEFAVVHQVLRQGLSDRSGTVGLDDTLMALNGQQVRELAMSRRFDVHGVRCGSCDGLWTRGAPGCVFCGQPVELVPLRDEILRRAVLQGAEVSLVTDGGPLDAYRGVGSLLRRVVEEIRPPFEAGVTSEPTPTRA